VKNLGTVNSGDKHLINMRHKCHEDIFIRKERDLLKLRGIFVRNIVRVNKCMRAINR